MDYWITPAMLICAQSLRAIHSLDSLRHIGYVLHRVDSFNLNDQLLHYDNILFQRARRIIAI